MSRASVLAGDLVAEIHDLTSHLVQVGLVDDQNFASRRDRAGGSVVIESGYWSEAPRVMEKVDYVELYARLSATRAYDLRFLDGALVQMRYELTPEADLRQARVAFLPAPDLTPFQEDSELYLHDELFGEVVDRRAVTVPLRFDFDGRPESVVELHHPHSHLTLGQYPHCRVPVTSGLTPYYFIEFLLRSFYRTRASLGTEALPGPRVHLPRTITDLESSLLHVGVPHLA